MNLNKLEHFRRIVEANVSEGTKALLVSDIAADERVNEILMFLISEAGGEATLVLFEPRPADYYDPPVAVAGAMLSSDINFLLASTGMLHSPASAAAMKAGIPSICMDGGLSLETFQDGALTADYTEIARMKRVVALDVFGPDADEIRVTSELGTDITYSVKGRIFIPPEPGEGYNPYKAWRRSEEGRPGSLYAVVLPGGELNIAPVEGTANGSVVIDTSAHFLGKVQNPVELVVRDGWIVDIRGSSDARRLQDYLAEFGDDNAYCFPTEASVGMNRRALLVGNQREDKNVFGTMHFGLGTNADVGGTVHSNIHIDGVVLKPTVYVDGQLRIENGQFLTELYQSRHTTRV
jgi:2,5-dihydroxypyridine 5,6-dioxygenase